MGVGCLSFGAHTFGIWHPKVVQPAPQMAAVFAQSAPRRLTMLSCLLLIVAIILYLWC
jgi:hypothetical protein